MKKAIGITVIIAVVVGSVALFTSRSSKIR